MRDSAIAIEGRQIKKANQSGYAYFPPCEIKALGPLKATAHEGDPLVGIYPAIQPSIP
jgi:hypothetical protein